MADSVAFTFACSTLEKLSSLSGVEAKFAMRLALREAGFEAATVAAPDLSVVVQRVLPGELRRKQVPAVETICKGIADALSSLEASGPMPETPDTVFRRLGGA
jgi:hypothetical protein